ncbi:DUF3383 domain-containing protein [Herbaspirillum huttiense]|uniref:DUF3383 domain-containing protein n=2 Tax=Herbaspirillum huttiense TaxID=863372 RepID=A0AAJ2HFF2_9BURK|nr:DUF3383 domain-containing protein [Herbaspirillum huttiense]MDR9839457.1 DUF3383 domain-containing protein [Herbaspirillum huttiense]
MSIPASQLVQVNPGVIGAGGAALDLIGTIMTNNTAVPIGSVLPFPDADSVGAFFGSVSTEKSLADIYFKGRDNATKLPGRLLFAQYPTANVAAYVRGGSLAAMTLAQLQALSGTLIVTVDGTAKTSSAINLSAATSFSNAATIMQAGFSSLGGTVSYDAQRAAFVITSATTGATSTISYVSGTLAAGLLLTQATGAVLSQGAIASVPATAMDAVVAVNSNWAGFMTTFEPVTADKLAFSAWVNSKNKRFVYVGWDTDITATQANNTTSWGAQAKAANYDGSVPVYQSISHAAFVLGMIASIDFDRKNGRITFAFKGLSGLTPSVTDATIASNLKANGYNFYGDYATSSQDFQLFYPGSVTGKYLFLDEYVNQIWLNAGLQQAMVTMLQTENSIPYNTTGNTTVDAYCNDPIGSALNFGAIRGGVPLSAGQAVQVNNSAGVKIDNVLATRGWYLQILAASAQVRAQRGSPPITFWYMDGGSVQQITLASIVIQ